MTSRESAAESRINRNLETVLAVFLGLVAVGIAYASFQAALYDGKVISANTLGTNQATEAQALYLEGNQQWVQDAQLFDTLNLLALDTDNPDPAVAAAAQIKYDTIYFQSVSDEFDAAIKWAAEQNEVDPNIWYSPLDSEDYQDFLYSSYDEKIAESDATLATAAAADTYGDRHMLNTVLMALALFLFGLAAVVHAFRVKLILAVVGVAIFGVAVVLTAAIPFLWL
jgi:hypothetical protein